MTADYCERSMRLLLTCGLDVNAAGGSFHETRGHVVLRVLLREPGVLVAHQPVLQHGHCQNEYYERGVMPSKINR